MLHIRSKFYLLFLAMAMLLGSSCRKDFEYQDSEGNLSFSKDTVYLDTVFSTISSRTYSLKVYNKSKSDVQIPSITLAKGLESNYRINVAGQAGINFYDTPLLAKDSLYIFIETTVGATTNQAHEFLDTDALVFDSGAKEQRVALVTLIKDAIFLYPKKNNNEIHEVLILPSENQEKSLKITGFILDDNQLNFTNQKPYVIYGYAAIPENKTLNIDKGARVYFHKNSGLWVQKNSSLQVNGDLSTHQETLESEVIFEGDRLEPEFSDIAGQWGTIWFDKESYNHRINYLTLKNGTVGLLVEGTNTSTQQNLKISNSQIYNNSSTNLWAKSASIEAENVVLGNAGGSSLQLTNGGTYDFTHVTVANYWSDGFRTAAALQIDNLNEKALYQANFTNCIIDGSKSVELAIRNSSDSLLNFFFDHCMLKVQGASTTSNNPLYDFSDATKYQSIFLNEDAAFTSPRLHNFLIKENSFAIGKGTVEGALAVPKDIRGKERTNLITLGAYQY
ncbi:hypothetical protein [Cellulophaga sp. Hel_I_12]|uniref:hypothetical protein n=1 Tax=Cellulophaga sp. Hel_I_12 TaxID=1249972 RepID=UPI000648EEDF|nr:hypothetical protein [Cellulophaga sp. Hel_I_12]